MEALQVQTESSFEHISYLTIVLPTVPTNLLL